MMFRNLILAVALLMSFSVHATENVKAVGAVAKANLKAMAAVVEANIKSIGVVDNTSGGGPSVAPGFVSTGDQVSGGSLTCAATMTVSAGDNRIMLVAVGQGNAGGTPQTISTVIWSGNGVPQAMTFITGSATNDGNFCSVACYYLVAPTAETGGSVTATFAGAPSLASVSCAAYTNADQTPIFASIQGLDAAGSIVSLTVATGTGQRSFAATANDANSGLTIGGTSSPTERNTIIAGGDMTSAIGDTTGSGTFEWDWSVADDGGVMMTFLFDGI